MVSKFGWLLWFGATGILAGALWAISHSKAPEPVTQNRRPFIPRPRPPEPAPPPITDDRRRIFEDLRPHFLQLAREAAARQVQDEFNAAIEQLKKDPDVLLATDFPAVVEGEPPQAIGILGGIFASAVVSFIIKAIKFVLLSLITGAIVAFLVTYWQWIAIVYTAATTVICWPIAKLAAARSEPEKK